MNRFVCSKSKAADDMLDHASNEYERSRKAQTVKGCSRNRGLRAEKGRVDQDHGRNRCVLVFLMFCTKLKSRLRRKARQDS